MQSVDPSESGTLTNLLSLSSQGDETARNHLFELIYKDLHAAARNVLRRHPGATCNTTDLLHESMIRFQDAQVLERYSTNRRVFFSIAIRAMQQVMIDHYRRQRREDLALKDFPIIDATIEKAEERFGADFEQLTAALAWLEQVNPRQHAAITHRFFGGLTTAQTAELLEVATSTIERDCRLARAKLLRRLLGDSHD
jgi:RNA polymerase sigma factor (TIGR02999 family)